LGDVLRDHAETRSCLRGALLHWWFTGKLVRQSICLRHALRVLTSGGG
jgi:hypothetical protein